jgi:hypothetical protein
MAVTTQPVTLLDPAGRRVPTWGPEALSVNPRAARQ